MYQISTLNDGNATKEHTKFVVLALKTFLCGKKTQQQKDLPPQLTGVSKISYHFPVQFPCTFTVYLCTTPCVPSTKSTPPVSPHTSPYMICTASVLPPTPPCMSP